MLPLAMQTRSEVTDTQSGSNILKVFCILVSCANIDNHIRYDRRIIGLAPLVVGPLETGSSDGDSVVSML